MDSILSTNFSVSTTYVDVSDSFCAPFKFLFTFQLIVQVANKRGDKRLY